MRSLDWMADAVCAQTDPELWFPEGSGQHTRKALRICATCPVRAECADYAQALEDGATEGLRHGAWGGLSARQRSRSVPGSATALRDQQIMRLSDRGMTPTEIADQLSLSDRTVLRVRAANRQEEAA